MEEEEIVTKLSRKELRKQKLMEYLSGKGKLKQPTPRPVGAALQVVSGKENKVPADRFTHESTKVKTRAAEATKLQKGARGVFRNSCKVNVSANDVTGRQSDNRPSATYGSARPQLNQNHLLTRRTTALSYKSNPNVASHLKEHPNGEMPSPRRASSKASGTAASKSNGSSRAAGSRSSTAVSVRISLGPMVKTKTGLVPAAIQPRDVQSHRNLTRTSATAADPTTKKMQLRTLTSVSASRKSAVAPSKPLRPVSFRKNQGAGAGINVPNQAKSNSKPLVSRTSQPPSKVPPSSGLRSTQGSRAGASGQPTERSTKHRSEAAGHKKRPPCQVAPQTSSRPAISCCSNAPSGVLPAAAAEKNRKCGGADAERGRGSAKAPSAQAGLKRTSAARGSQAVPRPNRTVGHTGHAADTKTPTVPVGVMSQAEGRKVTAAQEERVRKLKEWREAKGISYKRPPMPVKPLVRRSVAAPEPFWGSLSEEDEARSLVAAVDRSLADCLKLLEEGLPTHRVREVLSRLPPVSRKFAKYWICRARLMERDGHLDVLPVFEEAVGVVLEPLDELRTAVFQILKKKDGIKASGEREEEEEDTIPAGESAPERIKNPTTPPRPARALICGEGGDSSVVKYRITSTPGGALSHPAEPARVNGQEVRFLTPVRRSVRIERTSLRYPASLQDHDLCVASYGDLISEEEQEGEEGGAGRASQAPMYVYRQNEALQDRVFVRLVYDDAAAV
ncbi:cytoskeleton-associated protein 2-like [Spinachia spinachia]